MYFILSWQFPQPLTTRPKPNPTGRYSESFLGSFEGLPMRDALIFPEQPCRSGHALELRYTYIVPRECVPQKFSDNGFVATARHGSTFFQIPEQTLLDRANELAVARKR